MGNKQTTRQDDGDEEGQRPEGNQAESGTDKLEKR